MSTSLPFASGEEVWVVTNSGSTGYAKSASQLGPVNPCSGLLFYVNAPIPAGYSVISKCEWFVNGISTYTNTSGDPSFPYNHIIANPTSVYCKVTYKDLSGNLTIPSTSTTFTPIIKDLDFPQTITTSTTPANYGCASATVSYSLPEVVCSGGGICNGVYNALGAYNVTWQAPAGWVQTSLTNKGSDVSFTPDATSSGTLTATIHLTACSFTETRTFTTTRGASVPTFATTFVTSCTSSATMSINPTCGASNYTYSVVGNPGVTFAANGLQGLTTTSTTVNFNISGGYSVNKISVKANYPNNISSLEANANLIAGSPSPSAISPILIDYTTGKLQVESLPAIDGATSYSWYKDGALQSIYHSTFAQISITRNVCNVGYGITVTETNGCGTSAATYLGVFVPCNGNSYQVAPNPATSQVTVTADQSKSSSLLNKTFDEVRIYDFQGNLKKYQKFNQSNNSLINTSSLMPGNYFIEIINGSYTERQQLIIQK